MLPAHVYNQLSRAVLPLWTTSLGMGLTDSAGLLDRKARGLLKEWAIGELGCDGLGKGPWNP